MEIRRLNLSDSDAYFENRLRALENTPSAFLTTLAEEKARGRDFFAKILGATGESNVIFGAVLNGKVIGATGIRREERAKTSHKAMIWGMGVDLEYRRSGVGGKLLDVAIQHAREKMQASAIYLSVASQNASAKRLYELRGFKTWGIEPLAVREEDGRFLSDDHMALIF